MSKKQVAEKRVLCATICAYIYKQLWKDLQEMNYIGGFWRKELGSWGTKAEVRFSLFIFLCNLDFVGLFCVYVFKFEKFYF